LNSFRLSATPKTKRKDNDYFATKQSYKAQTINGWSVTLPLSQGRPQGSAFTLDLKWLFVYPPLPKGESKTEVIHTCFFS